MKEGNFAFIDSQNVNLAILSQGWKLDWKRFRQYLKDSHSVSEAFLFIGYEASNEKLYRFLSAAGFTIIFKPTVRFLDGRIKGNIDAELVLHTLVEWNNYERAVIVTNDGDFYCLVKYLVEQNKLANLIIPDRRSFSSLLKEFRVYMYFMNELQRKLAYKKSP